MINLVRLKVVIVSKFKNLLVNSKNIIKLQQNKLRILIMFSMANKKAIKQANISWQVIAFKYKYM